jgi:hypothetical protein
MSSLESRALDERTEACEVAYRRALAAYRIAGVIRVTTDARAGQIY